MTLLHAAAEVARLAGSVAARHFRTGIAVETKADGTPVTAADREAEAAAREWLTVHFRDDGILGEEYGASASDAGRRWVIDPIDGTKSFVRGVPLWGTLVALCERTSVLVGAAYFPAVNEMIVAAPGEGCWCNDVRCHVSDVDKLADATVLTTDTRFAGNASRLEGWRALAGKAGLARTWGDAYGYLLVATGRAEVMVDPVMNPWDAAPFLPIIEEAGGVFADWSGQRTVFGGSGIASNRALATEARTLLGAGLPR